MFSLSPNGGWPSAAAYRVEPREKTSDSGPGSPPMATSGARYAGVPAIIPVLVTVTSSVAREMPKSVIFTVPLPASRMLPGLMSRWTMPTACASLSAAATCAPIFATSTGGSVFRCCSSCARLVDGRYSMIRHG